MDRKLPTKGVQLWALLMQHMQDCVAKHNLSMKQLADQQQQQTAAVTAAESSPALLASQPSSPAVELGNAAAVPAAETADSVVPEGLTAGASPVPRDTPPGGTPTQPSSTAPAPAPAPPLRESAHAFQNAGATASLKKHGIPEPDLQFLYRLFRHSIDATLVGREVAEVLALDELPKFAKLIVILIPLETNIVLYACPLIGNVVSVPEVRERSDGNVLLDIVLGCIASYPMQRRVVHLCLMTVSNIALVQRFKVTSTQARQIALAVIPLYSEAPVVEAWSCAVCNLSNIHPEVIPMFLSCAVIETLERLLLFFGDDARVVTRGLQALSNLSYGFVAGHNSTAIAAVETGSVA